MDIDFKIFVDKNIPDDVIWRDKVIELCTKAYQLGQQRKKGGTMDQSRYRLMLFMAYQKYVEVVWNTNKYDPSTQEFLAAYKSFNETLDSFDIKQ